MKAITITIIIVLLALFSYIFIDKNVALYFHENISKDVYHFWKIVSKFGEGKYFLIPSAILYIIYKNKDEFIKKVSILVFSSVAISGIVVNVLKIIFGRARPELLFQEDIFGFTWFHFGHLYASFPSGHTTTAFSGFVALALVFRKYSYIFLLLAFMIAFSRVILTMHYVSDVLIGSLLGSWTSYILYQKIFKGNK